jgi:YhcH/YjgK/YiaL family protein
MYNNERKVIIMILDNIKNASLYYNLSERIQLGLKYLQETDLSKLEPGKYELDGTNVYAVVSSYQSKTMDQVKWEAHKKYLDIQYIVEGSEKMGYAYIAEMHSPTEYNETKDVLFYEGNGDFVTVKTNNFAIFFPEDVHAPNMAIDTPLSMKKVVIKIAI